MGYRFILIIVSLLFWLDNNGVCLTNYHDSDISDYTDASLKKSIDFSQQDPDSSIFYALKSLQKAEQANDPAALISTYQQLGYIYYNQNNFSEAELYFNKSLRIAVLNDEYNGQALALNRLGNVSQLNTNYLKALDYYLKALEINERVGNKAEIARTLVNLANVYSVIGQYQRSIEHFLAALNIHASIEEKEGFAWNSLGIARLFKKLDLLDRAMQYAESALEYYKEIELETGKSVGVTLSLSEIGSIYHKLGNYDKSLEYTQMVLEINERTGNRYGQAANNISLGIIFFDKGQNDLALMHLNRAEAIKTEISDSLDLAPLYRYLGKLVMRNNDYAKAQQYFIKSLQFAQKHRLIPDLTEVYLNLSDVYTKTGQHVKALEAYKNHSSYKDSINSSDIARLDMQYEFEKREKEQELLARQREALQEIKLERQRVVLLFFVVAFLLAGSLAAFIFYAYREKRRINLLLVAQNNEISRQNREIEQQKEEIEQQRDFVTRQRDQIADQQKLITDSITYASRIQNAVLPSEVTLKKLPWDSFVFYQPKNIVSGDFYWVSELSNGNILLAVGDCTGHGVPGAFMSMLGITLLREVAGMEQYISPADMLSKLREMVLVSLNQQAGKVDQADGMDMSIVIIDPKTLVMEFAGAYLPAIICRKGELALEKESINPRITQHEDLTQIEFKGDKMPIGHHIIGSNPFTNYKSKLEVGDMLYLFSDGYVDQFGGPNNVKFLMYNFRKLLFKAYLQDLAQQKELLISTIEDFKGDRKQVDDMLVIGIRIS
jgi:serine phosphatase RsbU (regulator of sigma subunit)/tetratricopeptide (TPR) repeat protein